ncbi:hypothetical protein B0H11DRAFT_161600 [Mycena galericulata]|nr:hypothetical protein B0H11DRAFT_161600 [Mycena galericulata]
MLDDEQTTPSSSQSLQGFLTRSGTTIEDITLHSSGLRDTQFLECLRSMPMLRHLDVEEMSMDTPFTDLVCEALTVSSVAGEATPPPLVTHLEFLSISADRLCDTPMVHMLKSRVGSTPISANTLPFKKVSLLTGNISNSAYDKLTELQRLGLNLTIDVHGGIDSSEESESSDSDEEDGETDEDTDPDDVSSDSG